MDTAWYQCEVLGAASIARTERILGCLWEMNTSIKQVVLHLGTEVQAQRALDALSQPLSLWCC